MLIGNIIFENRKKLKMSQEELAEKINVSRQTVSNWETNQTAPDIYQSRKLSECLNITLDELAGIGKEEKEILEIDGRDEDMLDISTEWNNIKEKIQEDISEISYVIWFAPIEKAKIKNDILILYCEADFAAFHINQHYREHLLKLMHKYYSKDIKGIKAVDISSSTDNKVVIEWKNIKNLKTFAKN